MTQNVAKQARAKLQSNLFFLISALPVVVWATIFCLL